MELSTVMNTLLSSDSLKSLSKKTGASQKEVKSVLADALPILLQGADNQAKDASTREGFVKALLDHSKDDTNDVAAFLGNVDMADGAKILGHLLGAEQESTAKKVSEKSSLSAESTTEILSAAAPLLMSLLGQETKKSSKSKNNELVGDLVSAVLDNVDVGSLLVGMLTDDTETKKTATKKTTAKKTTTKKSTTSKKSKKMKAASDDEGIDLGDVAGLLGKLLK